MDIEEFKDKYPEGNSNVASNASRRASGWPQDAGLPDFDEEYERKLNEDIN